jgi:hypothetical protein
MVDATGRGTLHEYVLSLKYTFWPGTIFDALKLGTKGRLPRFAICAEI